MSKPRVPRVAVFAGFSITWREQVMRGIADYVREHGPWHVYSAPEASGSSLFFSENFRWDGLILRVADRGDLRRVQKLNMPTVVIGSARIPEAALPWVRVDERRLTARAVRHFQDGGLHRFAYCGFSRRRQDEHIGFSFFSQLAEHGHSCDFYCEFSRLGIDATWQARQRDLIRWLKSLAPPLGILAWNPDVACQLMEACHRAGYKVPTDIAVISCGDDRMKCELTTPPLTALDIPAHQIGWHAAQILDQLLAGKPAPRAPLLIEPSGLIIQRGSTDTTHLDDWEAEKALRFIQDHAGEAITVATVAEQALVSRRRLERMFQRILGRSPHQEIHRVRIELARQFLLETDWPLERVARAAGLTSARYLVAVFRRDTGLTPRQFRRRFRG